MGRQYSESKGLLGFLEGLGGWIAAILGFANTVTALILLLTTQGGLAATILLWTGLGVMWISLIYIYIQKADPEKRIGIYIDKSQPERKFRYSDRARRAARVGIVAVPLLIAAGFGIWEIYLRIPPDKLIVLIADIYSPDQDKYALTRNIYEQLEKARNDFKDELQIKTLGRPIRYYTESEVIHDLGKDYKASIVLWGEYDAPGTTGQYTIHAKVLRNLPNLTIQDKTISASAPLSQFDQFEIQKQIAGKTTYLPLLILGIARYLDQDYVEAIKRFDEALKQPGVPEEIIAPGILYLYKGACHYQMSRQTKTVAEQRENLSEAIKAFKKAAPDNQGDVRLEAGDRWAASISLAASYLDLGRSLTGEEAKNNFIQAEDCLPLVNDNAGVSDSLKWAAQFNLGAARYEIGALENSFLLLQKASEVYRDALNFCAEQSDWGEYSGARMLNHARTREHLGMTLTAIGKFASGNEGKKNLRAARNEIRAAVEFYQMKGYRNLLAASESALANALAELGARQPGERGNRHFKKAISRYESALTFYDQKKFPQEFSQTQYYLAFTLREMGRRINGEEKRILLQNAVAAYEAAKAIACDNGIAEVCEDSKQELEEAKAELNNLPS